MRRDELERAYRAATYRAGDIVIRVGEATPALDAVLAARATGSWAYVTAYNPRSVTLPEDENRARQNDLLARLVEYTITLGEASADDGSWREPSVLVLGIARDDALNLARAFGQNAIVCGRLNAPAELVWVDPPP